MHSQIGKLNVWKLFKKKKSKIGKLHYCFQENLFELFDGVKTGLIRYLEMKIFVIKAKLINFIISLLIFWFEYFQQPVSYQQTLQKQQNEFIVINLTKA